MHLTQLANLGEFIGGVAVLVTLMTLVGGETVKGATRWIRVGGLSIQPSEFLKPAFVVLSAWLMAGSFERGGPPGRVVSGMVAMMIAAILALLMMAPIR